MTFIEQEGNLFETDFPALAHGCNCIGVMGAGVAAIFRQRYPEMFKEYERICLDDKAELGNFYAYKAENGPVIFNLFTQYLPGAHASLTYVGKAVLRALESCRELGIPTLGVPRIGAGIGGLKWEDVRFVLADAASQVPEVDLIVVTLPSIAWQI